MYCAIRNIADGTRFPQRTRSVDPLGRPIRSETNGRIQYNDRVQMVGHYLQLVQSRTNMVPRYGIPPVQYDQPCIIQFHHSVRTGACDLAENIATAVCADRYEIRTARVVVILEPRVFMEDRRHVSAVGYSRVKVA